MSIVKMQKVAVIGLGKEKESIMGKLMDFGAVELVDQKDKLQEQSIGDFVSLDDSHAKAAEIDAKLNRADSALQFLERYDPAREPLFKTRRLISANDLKKFDREQAERYVDEVLALEEKLRDTNDKINKLDQEETLIKPWIGYATPLEMKGTHKTIIHEGVVPTTVDMTEIINELEGIGGIVVKLINADKDLNYVAFICLRSKEEEIMSLLKQKGLLRKMSKELKKKKKSFSPRSKI